MTDRDANREGLLLATGVSLPAPLRSMSVSGSTLQLTRRKGAYDVATTVAVRSAPGSSTTSAPAWRPAIS